MREAGSVLLVDGANVVGSRPTGWWRDRPGAAWNLVDRLRRAVGDGIIADVVVVLEGQARQGVPAGQHDGLEVVHAPRDGDDTLVATAATVAASGTPVMLVSADRELGARARAVGAEVVGPTWLLDQLPA